MRRLLWAVVSAVPVFLAISLAASPAVAWGPEAHRAIASIADQLLQRSDTAARSKVQALLAADKDNTWTKHDIASEATWADVLREKSEEARNATAAWHAVRLKADAPDLDTACFGHKPLPEGFPASHGPRDHCAVDKIPQFQSELRDPETQPEERLMALQFLLNIAGDLSDPLLTIDHGDQGGRCAALQIAAGKPPVRLSVYWQSTLVTQALGGDAGKGAASLIAALTPAEIQKWSDGDPAAWVQDSYEIAKTAVYALPAAAPEKYTFPTRPGEKDSCGAVALYAVGAEYQTKALATVRTQLAKGGVRLARVLRDGFK